MHVVADISFHNKHVHNTWVQVQNIEKPEIVIVAAITRVNPIKTSHSGPLKIRKFRHLPENFHPWY